LRQKIWVIIDVDSSQDDFMIQAKTRFSSFEQYAALSPSELPEGNYELVNGVIIDRGAESLQNVEIAGFLFSVLLQYGPYYLLHRGTEIAVASQSVTSRFPDLLVLSEETRSAMRPNKRSLITPEMPAPCLVVEIVSPDEPGEPNYDRDYIEKRQEYAQRGISEFWLIDPARAVVLVLSLTGESYQVAEFHGADPIQSRQFQLLALSAQQILSAGEANLR
jgi:Uma2 family endonuclease